MLASLVTEIIRKHQTLDLLGKFDYFTATQILREIKFWQIQMIQKCHFFNSRGYEF